MSCKDCKDIVIESCEETLCDGVVSLPCDFKLADSCIVVTTPLQNIGTCKSKTGNYECTDLQTVLLAIDSLFENCGADTYLESGELDGTDLVLTLNDATEVTISLSGLQSFWSRNSGSGFVFPTTLTDSVGIGTNTPTTQLDVVGDFLTNWEADTNEDSIISNSSFSLTTPSGPSTVNGPLLAYLTATTANFAFIGEVGTTLQFDNGTVQSQILTSATSAVLQFNTGVNTYSSINATSGAEIFMTSTDGVDTTTLTVDKDNLQIDGNNGFTGTFLNGSGDTVTVVKGIITNVAP